MAKSKYSNRKIKGDSYTFDSKAEANFYRYLEKSSEKRSYKADFRVIYPDGTEKLLCILYFCCVLSFDKVRSKEQQETNENLPK